jgi:biotin operon repressor
MAPPKGKPQVKLNAALFAMAIEELMTGPTTAQTIADITGMGQVTVWHLIRALRKRGVVHIDSYEADTNGRQMVRVFALGHGEDAKRPPTKRNEKTRVARQRREAKAKVGVMFGPLVAVTPLAPKKKPASRKPALRAGEFQQLAAALAGETA